MSDPVVVKLFKKILDEVTDSDNLEIDSKKIEILVNMVDKKMISGKISIEELHKKILDKNPHTTFYALLVLEGIVQTCKTVHNTIISNNVLEILKKLSANTKHEKIKLKTMSLIDELDKSYNSQQLLDNENFNICENENKIPDDGFQGTLKKIQMDQKARYKAYLKSLGKSTSSDEEEEKEKEKPEGKQQSYFKTDATLKLNINQKVDKLAYEMKKKLPKDLEISKNQRKQLVSSTSEIRAEKHQSYVEDHTEVFSMKQCAQKNCEDCNRYKKSAAPEEPLPKQLPYEMRKVKESKLRIRSAFDEIKKEKQKEYYHKVKPLQ